MATVELTSDSFRTRMREEGITLVEFWGAWCKPCLTFKPVFEAASESHPQVQFATVDTQAEVTLAAELGVSGLPTIRAYRDGVQLMDHSGVLTMAMMAQVIEALEALDMDDVIERAINREPLPVIVPTL